MNRQYLGILFRLLMSVALLLLLLTIIDRDALAAAFSNINPALYLLGMAAFGGAIFFWTLRWYLFIRAAGEPVGFGKALTTLMMGLFYAMFLPSLVGTDVGRMYELARDEDNNRSNVVSTVLLDRLMGLITLSLIAVLALLVGSQFATDSGVVYAVVGALVSLLVGWFVFFNRRVMEFCFSILAALPLLGRFEGAAREIYEALYQLHNQPRLLLGAGGASLINSSLETLAAVFAAQALGIDVNPLYFFIFMPLIWLVTALPISVGGLGLREGAFVFFFTQVGVDNSSVLAMSLLFYSYNAAAGILGGMLLLRSTLAPILARFGNRQPGKIRI